MEQVCLSFFYVFTFYGQLSKLFLKNIGGSDKSQYYLSPSQASWQALEEEAGSRVQQSAVELVKPEGGLRWQGECGCHRHDFLAFS